MKLQGLLERLQGCRVGVIAPRVRELLYQLAIRGELTQQESDDAPPPAALLARALPWQDGEFELPPTWYWIQLGDATKIEMGQSPPSDTYNRMGIGLPFFQGKADFGPHTPVARCWCDQPAKIALANDVLISVRAPVGPTNVADRTCCIGRGLAALRPHDGLSVEFLLLSLKARETQLASLGFGTTFAAVGRKQLTTFLLPLPPPAEQRRIVQTIAETIGVLERLILAGREQDEARGQLLKSQLHLLANLDSGDHAAKVRPVLRVIEKLVRDAADVEKLRETVIRLGVRGKLVPQDPEDEAASELLKQIGQSEGGSVVEPSPSAHSFVLPPGWAWARFAKLGKFGRGRSKHRPRNDPALFTGGIYPLVQTGDVARSRGNVQTFTSKYNDVGVAQSRMWPAGTMCITIAANIADTGILSFDACFPDSVVGFIPALPIPDARYFEYFMRTAKANLQEFAPATAQKNISLEILNEIAVPVPPLREQRRIVQVLDDAMNLCDALQHALTAQKHAEESFVDATRHAIIEGGGQRTSERQSIKVPGLAAEVALFNGLPR